MENSLLFLRLGFTDRVVSLVFPVPTTPVTPRRNCSNSVVDALPVSRH